MPRTPNNGPFIERDPMVAETVGNRYLIRGDHPHAGKVGECVRWEESPWGFRPVVRFDDGQEAFVLDASKWKLVRE